MTVLSGVKGLAGARATEVRGGQCRPSRLPGTGVQPAGCLAAMGRCLRASEQGGLPLPLVLWRGGRTKASILTALLHPSAPFTRSQ